ncbi:unnamed protein product [Amoebophrya sp. A120]|nr:unnamed protein product [Amoebophrya sp. A120]|eukprot:GSA120T00017811001.1
MCFGHWMQCSFMSGAPQFGRKEKAETQRKQIFNELPQYEIPAKCTKPLGTDRTRNLINLYSFHPLPKSGLQLEGENSVHSTLADLANGKTKNGKINPPNDRGNKPTANGNGYNHTTQNDNSENEEEEEVEKQQYMERHMVLSEKGLIFGSATHLDGQVLNMHSSVAKQHCALLHNNGKLFLKAIDGVTKIWSMTEWKKVLNRKASEAKDKEPIRWIGNSDEFKLLEITGIDKLQKVSKNRCVFQLGDSPTVYWIDYKELPLGDTEHEEGLAELSKLDRERDKDTRKKDRDRDDERDNYNEKHKRSRSRGRSRERDRDRDRAPARDSRERDRRNDRRR